jgi:hypothetical protein
MATDGKSRKGWYEDHRYTGGPPHRIHWGWTWLAFGLIGIKLAFWAWVIFK